jgi:hypothetical protein
MGGYLLLWTNKLLNKSMSDRFFILKLNMYIMIIFIFLYYFLIPTEEMYFSNQNNKEYHASFLDYVYMTVIIHGTVGLGDITLKSNTGKILNIIHTLCVLGFNILLFN